MKRLNRTFFPWPSSEPVWAFLSVLLCCGLVHHGPAAASELVLESLVDVALARHPLVEAARAHAVAAAARAGASRAHFWPQISSHTSFAQTTNISASQTSAQPFWLSAAGFQVHQQVWDFGKTAQGAARADALAAACAHEVNLARTEAAFAARCAYFDWAFARAREAVAHKNYEGAAAVYEQTLFFWRGGRRSQVEVFRAEADREAARAGVVEARVAKQTAQRALCAALLLDELPPGEPKFPTLSLDISRPLVDWLSEGLGHHPALSAAAARAEAQAAGALGAARAGWPALMADANYGIRARDETPAALWSTGLSVSWPLFAGFSRVRNFEAAEAEARAAACAQREQARVIRLTIEQAYLVLQGARERRPVFQTRAIAARLVWDATFNGYQRGSNTLSEVSDARLQLLAAENDAWRAEAALHRALAEILRAVGKTGRETPND